MDTHANLFHVNFTDFEQKVINKQERKRVLADLVLGKSRLKGGDDGKKQLWVSCGPIAKCAHYANGGVWI